MDSIQTRKFDLGLVLSVIKTLIYFKVRAIRPTLVKVQRLLLNLSGIHFSSVSLSKIREILSWLQEKGLIEGEGGIYQWGKDQSNVPVSASVQQSKIVAEKMKIAVRAIRILKLIPAIKLIGVCGTVATGNPRESSDIDLFIVTKAGRIWSTRLWIMVLLEVAGLRKKKYKKAGRICLNYLVADDNLELKFKDLYTALEFVSMICLLDRGNTLRKLKMKNLWIKKYLPNAEWPEIEDLNYWQQKIRGQKIKGSKRRLRKIVVAFNLWEKLAMIFQERRIKRKRKKEKGGQVYWGADALIFHPKPKSILFRELYQQELVKQKRVIQGVLGEVESL
ncbi:MAG: nucleotidyltransferase domain-containing protein [Patescibacteria group bacterium]|nr:nucleotidyltransferase domain-containing protein [Patescibacteria group bacterium]